LWVPATIVSSSHLRSPAWDFSPFSGGLSGAAALIFRSPMSHPTLVTGAAGFAGIIGSTCSPPRGDVVGWHRPGRVRRRFRGLRWHAVDMLDRMRADAIRLLQPRFVYHCAGARRVGPGIRPRPTLATTCWDASIWSSLRDTAPDAQCSSGSALV